MVLLIIQARMGSSRLPGKVLKEVLDRPLLEILITRVRYSKSYDHICVATTIEEKDKVLVDFCKERNIPFFLGSQNDVLDRFYRCASWFSPRPTTIIRITGDCPLIDPGIIDVVYSVFKNGNYDYVANTVPPIGSFPDGMDVEVFSFNALEKSWKEAKKDLDREHVTFYMWQNPKLFKCFRVERIPSLSHYRLTVDYPQDFKLVKQILNVMYPKNEKFSLEDIVSYLEAHKELQKINSSIGWNTGWKN